MGSFTKTTERQYLITGRVQLVMFRDFACRKARGLGLFGWVKNNTDGSVTVVTQGSPEKLATYEEKLKKGSLLARVDNVSLVRESAPNKLFDNFEIVYK